MKSKDLNNHPVVLQWKKKYKENDVTETIKMYNDYKERAKSEAANFRQRITTDTREAELEAVNCLKEILHKKLFNSQCLWRAGQIDLPIKNSYEISMYDNNLFKCRLIEPISKEELDEYISYYLSDNYQHFPEIVAQDYDRLKDYAKGQEHFSINQAFEDIFYRDVHYPHWYSWYDRQFGTSHLIHLMDLRGEEESKWLQAYHKKVGSNTERLIDGFAKIGQSLFPNLKTLLKFAKEIEDYRMISYLSSLEKLSTDFETEQARYALDYLENIFNRDVPIGNFDDWRPALEDAVFRDIQKNVLKLLPVLYEQYLKEDYFSHRYFNEKTWIKDQKRVESYEKMLAEGREYLDGKSE